MNTVGQIERRTQERVIRLLRDDLGYEYLGSWQDRLANSNIEPDLLRAYLTRRGYDSPTIDRALFLLEKGANDTSKRLYDRNRDVYTMLRYGVQVKLGVDETTRTVSLIDWEHPTNNQFAVAEEVTVSGADARSYAKRPDLVFYVNGIALGVLELKRSTVSVSEGIRQNLDNQKRNFIEPFFSTIQFVMAGNDTEGLRYGAIETPEKYYLTWKEENPGYIPGGRSSDKYLSPSGSDTPLDHALRRLMEKNRFLELIHDFIVFDRGTKKLCRHNQYFGVRAARKHVERREGGIIWHTQGSGKSLTMVWLARWIREHVTDARVLIVTDRDELDKQIQKVFQGVDEEIYRTRSGADLIAALNAPQPWLLCSLIHKFGRRDQRKKGSEEAEYLKELRTALPRDFLAKGDLYVFVDECHRTQTNILHDAMKELLPNAMFIGFTGTPLLKSDKQTSMERFGSYIHTYKFDEAVRDGVVLDLRYEARDIDQNLTSQERIDQWFEAKTSGLTTLAKAQLKKRWGTMRSVMSSQDRLARIANDIMMDMATRDRLRSGNGNALLVTGSIYQACKLYELFDRTDLKGKCAIITSYTPSATAIKGEESGEGETEQIHQFEIYRAMLSEWFNEPPERAEKRVEEFEEEVKKKFIEEPGQMKLLIVVDKLLTGFDAPPATYLYIDKQMRDHSLFQAICRVNRLDGEDKEYGSIVDYKDLFRNLEGAVHDYTSEALDGYDREDIEGLLEDRLKKGRERLDDALEALRALCEPVEPPRDQAAYFRYFSSRDHGDGEQLTASEPQRLSLYTLTASLIRAYAAIANEMEEAGYSPAETEAIKVEVRGYENLRNEIKHHSGDAIDLKMYEPAMRHLIDTYIRADESRVVSSFDDMSLVELLVARGIDAVVDALPEGIRRNREAVAETIENNIRRVIIDEQPINPKYYDRMSELLNALIEQRKREAIEYKEYVEKIQELARQARDPEASRSYPAAIDSRPRRALYDNLERDERLAIEVDTAVRNIRKDGWRGKRVKELEVLYAIQEVLPDKELAERTFELVKNQRDY